MYWRTNVNFAALKKTSHRNTLKSKPNALIWDLRSQSGSVRVPTNGYTAGSNLSYIIYWGNYIIVLNYNFVE